MAVPFRLQREAALEKALRAMLRASRKAVTAQERCDYWLQFQTNSSRAQSAEANLRKALDTLSQAESLAQEALDYA